MARVIWKTGKIVSIETRKGTFVLAQMLKEPFLRFYNQFGEQCDSWSINDVNEIETLFTTAITRQFLRKSNILEMKKIKSDTEREDSDIWINHFALGSRNIIVWKGTEEEKTILLLGTKSGGSLVKKNLWWKPTEDQRVRPHISGVIDEVLVKEIPLNDAETIDKYELTNIRIYGELNERLYLCYKMKKNIDPLKDLIFNRPIPPEYKTYVDIISGSIKEDEWLSL